MNEIYEVMVEKLNEIMSEKSPTRRFVLLQQIKSQVNTAMSIESYREKKEGHTLRP